jgi:hypothetical protein
MSLNLRLASVLLVGLSALLIEAAENTIHPLPERVYTHIHSFMSKSNAFRGSTLEDTKNWVDRYDNWEAPKELQQKFPYYQSGFDKENRPVWVGEIGKFAIRQQIEKGPDAAADLEKYLLQASLRIGKSMLLKDTPEKPVRQAFFIADWEASDFADFAHLPTLNFVLRLMRTYVDILTEAWGYCVSINVNNAAKRGLDLVRPVIGGVLDKMDVYGEEKEKWMAGLKKYLPEQAIPSWYGGRPDFKPLAIYG